MFTLPVRYCPFSALFGCALDRFVSCAAASLFPRRVRFPPSQSRCFLAPPPFCLSFFLPPSNRQTPSLAKGEEKEKSKRGRAQKKKKGPRRALGPR